MPRSNSAGIAFRGAGVGDALRSAREDDAGGLASANLVGRRVGRPNLRVHGELTKAPRDELCVLRSEIQNEDRLMAHWGPVSDAGWEINRYYNGVRKSASHNML